MQLWDCACVRPELDQCPYFIRWTIGYATSNVRHYILRARLFLSFQLSVQKILGNEWDPLLYRALAPGGGAPAEPLPDFGIGKEPPKPLTVPAVNLRWGRLSDALQKTPLSDSVCVRFCGIEERLLEEAICGANIALFKDSIETVHHSQCPDCKQPRAKCALSQHSETVTSYAESIREDVIDPLSGLIKEAVAGGLGIYVSHLKRAGH